MDSFSESPTLAPRVAEGDQWKALPENVKAVALPTGVSTVTPPDWQERSRWEFRVETLGVDHGGQQGLVDLVSGRALRLGADTVMLSKPRHRRLESTLGGTGNRWVVEQDFCYAAFLTDLLEPTQRSGARVERCIRLLTDGRVSQNDVRRMETLSPETREWILTMLERCS